MKVMLMKTYFIDRRSKNGISCISEFLVKMPCHCLSSSGQAPSLRDEIQDILEKGTIKPVTNQVECHPYLQQQNLIDFCANNEIIVTALEKRFSFLCKPCGIHQYLI